MNRSWKVINGTYVRMHLRRFACMCYMVLYCIVLYCIVLYGIVLCYIVLCCMYVNEPITLIYALSLSNGTILSPMQLYEFYVYVYICTCT